MNAVRALVAIGAAVLLLGAGQASAGPATIGVERFDTFMTEAGPICAVAPARICIERAWSFADRDRDGELAAGELAAIKNEMDAWAEWKKPEMSSRDRASVAVGQMLVRSLQPSSLIGGFDSDGNGLLSRDELTQDLTLDDRPLPEILQDKAAVDWQSVQERLGAVAPLLALLAQAQGAR